MADWQGSTSSHAHNSHTHTHTHARAHTHTRALLAPPRRQVVRRSTQDGVAGNALTLTGFLYIQKLFIERGRIEATSAACHACMHARERECVCVCICGVRVCMFVCLYVCVSVSGSMSVSAHQSFPKYPTPPLPSSPPLPWRVACGPAGGRCCGRLDTTTTSPSTTNTSLPRECSQQINRLCVCGCGCGCVCMISFLFIS